VDEAVGRRAILAEMESFETVGKEVMEFLEAYNHLLVQFDDYIFSHLLKRLDGYSGILRGYIISHTLTFVILVLAAFIYFSLIRRTNIALRKSREELEILVAERTQDLEEKGKSLQAALKDKEFLLREIDHRVKNNLAMVSSLINLHLADEDNPVNRKRLEDLGGQIGSISMIHENLHRTDQVHYVRLKEYLEDLLVRAFSLGMYRIRLDIHVEPEYLHSQQAVPLGLIINELATNSLKHGFNGAEDFVFRVVLEKDESTEEYILIISNNGKPFPEEIRLDNPSTLGLRLIAALVRQLGGTLSLKRRPYPEFMIRFPVESK
jgi:two-component sensor histidine kinase